MLAAPGLVRAQARKVSRIGWLITLKKTDPMFLAGAREFRAAFEKKSIEILLISTQAKMGCCGKRSRRAPGDCASRPFSAMPCTPKPAALSYGPDFFANLRAVAEMVDQILKCAKPADMPLRQTMNFEIPASLRLRAERVIE